MAKLSNINGRFAVEDDGAIQFNGQAGTSGYVLESRGASSPPVWTDRDTGNVTGSGTLNKVPRWTATGSNLGDGPITFATNDSTFAGNVGIGITPSASFSGLEVLQLGKGMTIFGNTNDDRATMAANLIVNTGTAFEYVMDGLAGRFSIEDGNMVWGTAPTGSAGATATVTTRMTLLNTGNVGIGTDSPDTRLHIYGSSTVSEIYLGEDAAVDKAGILKYNQGDGTGTGSVQLGNYGDSLNTNGVTIKKGGNVGIGATNVEGRLDVRMNFLSQNWVPDGTSAKWAQVWDNAGTPGTYFDDVMLHVDTNRNGSTTGGVVGIAFSPGWQGHQNWGIYSINTGGGSYTSGDLIFTSQLDNGNIFERVRFQGSTGNVGIGTTSPIKKLDISEVYADSASAVENLQLVIRGSQNDLNPVGDSCGLGFAYSGSTATSTYIKTGIINEFTNSNGTSSLHLCTSAVTSAHTITKADARLTILSGGNVGIGLIAPVAKLHVEGRNASNVINAQMLIGYNGNSQNFLDADNHYFRNSAFVNILQLAGDTILGTPNNTQRLKITTDYSQIGPLTYKYPYYRTDSFRSDGTGYFWAFGSEKFDGTQSINMLLNDGITGNKTTRIINNLHICSFASNEYNGSYPSFTTNVVLRNNGTSYLNGGNVGIGDTSVPNKLSVKDTANLVCRFTGGTTFSLYQNNTDSTVIFSANHGNTSPTGVEKRFIWQMAGGTAKMKLDDGNLTVSGDVVAYGSPSDKRLKENIKPIESALNKVSKLQGVTFDWKDKKQNKAYDPDQDWKHDVGFIAQDVQKVIPELVRENEDGMLSMRHQGIAPRS
jgi:hypothetical protein